MRDLIGMAERERARRAARAAKTERKRATAKPPSETPRASRWREMRDAMTDVERRAFRAKINASSWEKREAKRAEADRERLLELYDHPATARLLRLVNATRWSPEAHLASWLEAADEIPEDLRAFAFGWHEIDPLREVAMRIASMGGDTLDVIGRLYGVTREYVRQVEATAIRKIQLAQTEESRVLRTIAHETISPAYSGCANSEEA